MKEKLFKCLEKGRIGPFSDFRWSARKWVKAEGELRVCENGIHLCREKDLVYWFNAEIWEAEYRGEERIDSNDKIVVREARLTRKLKTWNEKMARLFAADCAEHVLCLYEGQYPGDDRPRKAIEAARKYAHGKILKNDLEEVAEAAMAAAEAARAAAEAAGGAAWAAWAAVEAAAGAAGAAAWEAAGGTAWAAVEAAAGGTAWAAAWAAAGAAAWAAEREWQAKRLLLILDGKLYANKNL